MSPLVMALLLSWAMVAANHYFPWMYLFHKGQPGLIMWTMHAVCILIPFTGLATSWGYSPIWQIGVLPQAGAWMIALWALAVTDIIIEFLFCIMDRIIADRETVRAAEEEARMLRAQTVGAPETTE